VGGLKETIMGGTNLAFVDPVTADIDTATRNYSVAVDHSTLRAADLGAKGTGYSVALSGRIDGPWIRCSRSVQGDSSQFSQFVLDPNVAWRMWFLCRSDDGPADVIAALQALDDFVHRVNQCAASH
jgi:hypothetical protein